MRCPRSGCSPGWPTGPLAMTTITRSEPATAQRGTMGSGVGTPIIHLGASAIFGPVMTGVPRGSEALQVFDGCGSWPRIRDCLRSSVH